jgi:hypothetical protein
MTATDHPTLRPADEIQRAHDILIGMDPALFERLFCVREQHLVLAAADVLCWVLRHEHNQGFASKLAEIEDRLREMGMVLIKDSEQ